MKTKTSLWIAIVAIVLVAVLATACTNTPTGKVTTESKEPIKIGLSAPLSGEAVSFGQNAVAGAQLAINEINANGGVNGRPLVLVAEDDACSAKSVAAVTKLVTVDNVAALVGPLCSSAAGPALPITAEHNVPVMLYASSAPKLTSIGTNIYRLYPSDSFQGVAAADFMYNTLGKKKVALLYVQNDWGEGLQEVFTKRFKELGGVITYSAGATQDNKDFKTQLLKIKDTDAEAIYLPLYPIGAVAALRQMNELGMTLLVVSGDAFSDDSIITSGYANGAVFTMAKIDYAQTFDAKIHTVEGYQNLKVLFIAPLTYDSVKVLAAAMQKAGTTDPTAVEKALAETHYAGVSMRMIEFKDRELAKPEFDYKTVRNNAVEEYTFPDATPATELVDGKPVIKIGVIGMYTGDSAPLGISAKNSVILASEKLSNNTKYHYELVFEDDRMDPKLTASAFQKVVNVDGVDAVISMTSGPGNVVSPLANANKVLHCGIASDKNIASGDYNFIHWTTPEAESRAFVKALQKRNITRVAVLSWNQQGNAAIVSMLHNDIAGTSIQIVSEQTFNSGEKDFKTMLLKAADANPEVIMVESFSPELELIAKQAKDLGLTIPFTSIEAIEFTEQPQLFEGSWYVQAAGITDAYKEMYHARFNMDPKIAGPNAYDCFDLIVTAYENAGRYTNNKPTALAAAKEFAKIQDFHGEIGVLNVDSNHIVQSEAVVRQVKGGKFVTIDG